MARSALKGHKNPIAFYTSQTVCRESTCDNLATASGYCRMHYIKNWHQIKRKESILTEGMLQKYISELVDKYPEKIIGGIRQDLSSDENFKAVVRQLIFHEAHDAHELHDLDDDLDSADSFPLDVDSKRMGSKELDSKELDIEES